MHPTQPEERRAEDEGSRIVATLSRIADEAREQRREAFAAAITRHHRVTQVAAESGTLPRVG